MAQGCKMAMYPAVKQTNTTQRTTLIVSICEVVPVISIFWAQRVLGTASGSRCASAVRAHLCSTQWQTYFSSRLRNRISYKELPAASQSGSVRATSGVTMYLNRCTARRFITGKQIQRTQRMLRATALEIQALCS